MEREDLEKDLENSVLGNWTANTETLRNNFEISGSLRKNNGSNIMEKGEFSISWEGRGWQKSDCLVSW